MKDKRLRILTIVFAMLTLALMLQANQTVLADARQDTTIHKLSYSTVASGGLSSKTMQEIGSAKEEETDSNTIASAKVNASSYARYTGSYGYNTLSTTGKKVYKSLVKVATSFHNGGKNAKKLTYSNGTYGYVTSKADISSNKVSVSELSKIAFAFEADYPMFYWYDGVSYNTISGKVVSVCITVDKSYYKATSRATVQKAINKGLKAYTSKIDSMLAKGSSDFDIELAVHDLLIGKCTYALDSYGEPQDAAWAHNIYGIFGKNTAVCQGYAKAFQMLMHYADIDSIYAIGFAGSSYTGHAWNLVKLGGTWYGVDTTWDDIDDYSASLGTGVMYNYFNCSTSLLNKSHFYDYAFFSEMYKMPSASTKDTYWYYTYYNLKESFSVLPTENSVTTAIENAIDKIKSSGQYRLRFAINDNKTYSYGKTNYNEFYSILYSSTRRKSVNTLINILKGSNGKAYVIGNPRTGLYSKNMDPYRFVYVPVSLNVVSNIADNRIYFDSYQYKVTSTTSAGSSDVTSKTTRTMENGKMVLTYDGVVIGKYNVSTEAVAVAAIQAETYNGNAHKPKPVVKIDGATLVEGTDYTLSYANNVNAGTASITITGKGKYQGKKTVKFTINPLSLQNRKIATVAPKTYTGGSIVPTLKITNPNGTVVSASNYRISCKNNVNVGTATFTVTGIRNFTGTLTSTFKIVKRNVSTCTIASITAKAYTGKKLTPSVKVKTGSKTVLKTSDYKLTFSNNKKPGKAKVVITGIGANCTGSKTVYFNIVPKKVSGVKVTSSSRKIVVKWSKASYASGYKVYYSTSKNTSYKSMGTTTKTTLSKTGLKKGKTYYVRVRAYKLVDGKKKYGELSKQIKIVVK